MNGSTSKRQRREITRIVGQSGLSHLEEHDAALKHHTVVLQQHADHLASQQTRIAEYHRLALDVQTGAERTLDLFEERLRKLERSKTLRERLRYLVLGRWS